MYVVCPALVNLADILPIYSLPYSFYTAADSPHICCKNHRCYIKKFCKHYEKYIPQVGAKIMI